MLRQLDKSAVMAFLVVVFLSMLAVAGANQRTTGATQASSTVTASDGTTFPTTTQGPVAGANSTTLGVETVTATVVVTKFTTEVTTVPANSSSSSQVPFTIPNDEAIAIGGVIVIAIVAAVMLYSSRPKPSQSVTV